MLSAIRNLLVRGRTLGVVSTPARKPRRRCRPKLECLEDRCLLNSTFVVPTSQTQDSTHFYDPQAAINAAGPGGTVTIEPGSAQAIIEVNVANVTIQGDPNVSPSALPKEGILIESGGTGTILNHMNLSIVEIGASNVQVNQSLVSVAIDGTGVDSITISGDTFNGFTEGFTTPPPAAPARGSSSSVPATATPSATTPSTCPIPTPSRPDPARRRSLS